MDQRIKERIREIVRERAPRPERVLEVGGLLGQNGLLNLPELLDAERHLLNLVIRAKSEEINLHEGNSNDMHMFADDSFDLVLSNAVLEHDIHFWKTVAEMRRVLKPGVLMVIGVPGFATLPTDTGTSTLTYKVHHIVDYYRFSVAAVTDVFFEEMQDVRVAPMLNPPRIVGSGVKPGGVV